MTRRVIWSVLVACAVLATVFAPAASVAQEQPTLPNLVPVSKYPMVTDPQQAPRQELRFSTFIENHGAWSFEVVGHPDPADPAGSVVAEQCVRWAPAELHGASRTCLAYEPIGALVWHAIHNHFHLDGLARYRLLADDGGAPGVPLRDSGKVGFCLSDTFDMSPPEPPVPLDPIAREAHKQARMYTDRWYIECTHLYGFPYPGMRMGISPGWKDLYHGLIPGQAFDIHDLPDGTYWIETVLDAEHAPALRETRRDDNQHLAPVCVFHAGGRRTASDGACPP